MRLTTGLALLIGIVAGVELSVKMYGTVTALQVQQSGKGDKISRAAQAE